MIDGWNKARRDREIANEANGARDRENMRLGTATGYVRMETNTTKRRVTLAAKFRLADAVLAGLRGQVDKWGSLEIAKQLIAAHGLSRAEQIVAAGPVVFGGYLSY